MLGWVKCAMSISEGVIRSEASEADYGGAGTLCGAETITSCEGPWLFQALLPSAERWPKILKKTKET
ncbi:jg1354 [Pararge aegeria aegeria]|uniref:Jg1354 protein n=1 Tax=Pararge aegeria aegeria TaxID=348720 RepID=A0A8S4S3I0_9NEOP|nr:jg1354 [Pararge aegeria aegeria]